MLSHYPEVNKDFNFKEAKDMEDVIELITTIRRFKLSNNVKDVALVYDNAILKENKDILDRLLKLTSTENKNDVTIINFQNDEIKLYYDNSENKALEWERLINEKERLQMSIMRREKLLANPNYVKKAPKEIVENEKAQLEKEKIDLINIEKRLGEN